jgi:hypothetical protein
MNNAEVQRAAAARRQIEIAKRTADELGNEVICAQCGASVTTYGDVCMAPLEVRCPGFNRYDEVRRKHEALVKP